MLEQETANSVGGHDNFLGGGGGTGGALLDDRLTRDAGRHHPGESVEQAPLALRSVTSSLTAGEFTCAFPPPQITEVPPPCFLNRFTPQ